MLNFNFVGTQSFFVSSAVLWIREMLARIRIRGSGSCFFRQWLARCQQKRSFVFQSLFLLITILFDSTFTKIFKDKKSKEVTK
jgi:hypothetical protein